VTALYHIRGAFNPCPNANNFRILGILENHSSEDWNNNYKIGIRYSSDIDNIKKQLPVEFRGTFLHGSMASRQSIVFAIDIIKQQIPTGHCRVYVDLVNEGHYWLSDKSDNMVSVDLSNQIFPQGNRFSHSDASLLLDAGRSLALMGKPIEAFDLLIQSHLLDKNPETLAEARASLSVATAQRGAEGSHLPMHAMMQKVMASGFFDPIWYLKRYPDLNPKYTAPLQHFIEHGGYEWRSPGPHFDSEWYLLQNPDLIGGVEARHTHPLLHYIEHGAAEGRTPLPPTTTIIPTIQNLLNDVLDLDPWLYTQEHFHQVKSLRCVDNIPQPRSLAVFKRAFAALSKPYDYIITVPWMMHGGADLMAINMAKAMTSQAGPHSVLILAVDYTRAGARDWIPPNIDFLVLQDDPALSTKETVDVLLYLLQAVQPKAVINVNSLATWELIRIHGPFLSNFMRFYGCAFCRDYNRYDQPAGFADTHIRETLGTLAGVISDNTSFSQTLVEQFCIPAALQSRFITLYNPVDPISAANITSAREAELDVITPFKALWASRYVRQKNIALLRRIIELARDITFDVWGQGDAEQQLRDLARTCPNLNVMGAYSNFATLPLGQYGAFLYISLWDGIPNVLLEAAAADLPITASNVGGIHELVNSATGWLIDDLVDPTQYVVALRSIRDNPDAAVQRRRAMQLLISTRHSWSKFTSDLTKAVIAEEMTHEA